MPHRILFSDIDGTLLNADREVSALTIQQIKRIQEKVPVILISSRMPSAMIHLQEQLGISHYPLICYNGGLISIDGKFVQSTFIDTTIVESLYCFNKKIGAHISLYHNDDWYVPEMDNWAVREMRNTKVTPVVEATKKVLEDWKIKKKGAHKIMVMGDEKDVDTIFQFLQHNHGNNLHLYRSKPTYIEIAHKDISKLSAIQWILDSHFEISIADAVAFGDNYNDIAMLKGVGTGVAVANAKQEVLKIADDVTLAGKEDGVARYIQNYI